MTGKHWRNLTKDCFNSIYENVRNKHTSICPKPSKSFFQWGSTPCNCVFLSDVLARIFQMNFSVIEEWVECCLMKQPITDSAALNRQTIRKPCSWKIDLHMEYATILLQDDWLNPLWATHSEELWKLKIARQRVCLSYSWEQNVLVTFYSCLEHQKRVWTPVLWIWLWLTPVEVPVGDFWRSAFTAFVLTSSICWW